MKKHKHCEIIKAWAEGAPIQYRIGVLGMDGEWIDTSKPKWNDVIQYRVKPEPIPEIVLYGYAYTVQDIVKDIKGIVEMEDFGEMRYRHNLKLTFEGEAGKLIAAQVV